ncbi:hypothetical protein EC988_004859, partial [Linderina pennispora]
NSIASIKKSRSDANNVSLLDLDSMMSVILDKDVLKAINITDLYPPCADYSTNGEQPTFCSDPDTRFLYDPSHPSGRIEYILGVTVATMLQIPFFSSSSLSLQVLAKLYDIAHSDKDHNIIAFSNSIFG